jgi:AraC-like DNA-binding protein
MSNEMIFTKVAPSERLRKIINYFWWIELDCEDGTKDFAERILPDSSSEIVFHLGDKISRISQDNRTRCEPNCFFAGPNTSYYDIAGHGSIRMIGVKFYPHTASFLLRESAMQFNNTVVDLSAIWGYSISRIHERITEAPTLGDRVSIIERLLSARFGNEIPCPFEYLDFAVRRLIESDGRVPLSRIAQKLGITPRYLEKLFSERVGMPPKIFAQIIQLQNSVRLMAFHKDRPLTEICYASGYYDQSHFIRAVTRFTGLKPSELKRENMPMQEPFLDSIPV